MKKKNIFQGNGNDELLLILPRVLKHVCFDSGTFYHGEGYLQEYNTTEPRKTLVVAVWDKSNKPQHIPVYHDDLFQYHTFMKTRKPINDNTYHRTNSLVHFNTHDVPTAITITDNTIINEKFFNDLIIRRTKTVLYPLHKLIQPSATQHSFKIAYPHIVLKQIPDPVEVTPTHGKVRLRINEAHKYKLCKFVKSNIQQQVVIRSDVTHSDAFETIVHSVVDVFLEKMNLNAKSVFKTVTFQDKPIHLVPNIQPPLFSILLHINDATRPTLLTNVTYEEYKYKAFNKKSGLYSFLPKIWDTYLIDPSRYCYAHDEALKIDIWQTLPDGLPLYDTKILNEKLLPDDVGVINLNQSCQTVHDSMLFESVLYHGSTPCQSDEAVKLVNATQTDIKQCDKTLKSLRFDPKQFDK
jgi:hypothetical protein